MEALMDLAFGKAVFVAGFAIVALGLGYLIRHPSFRWNTPRLRTAVPPAIQPNCCSDSSRDISTASAAGDRGMWSRFWSSKGSRRS